MLIVVTSIGAFVLALVLAWWRLRTREKAAQAMVADAQATYLDAESMYADAKVRLDRAHALTAAASDTRRVH